MGLSLDQIDQRNFGRAVDALLSPLDYSTIDEWRRAVNRPLLELMNADTVSFLLPVESTTDMFSEELDCDPSAYCAHMRSELQPLQLQHRLRELMVANRPMGWGRHFRSLHKTAYWNDFAQPNKLLDSLTICVAIGPEPVVEHTAQLIFNHAAPNRPDFGEREVALGRLVLPAFRAGVMTWLQLQQSRTAFSVGIDDLDTPISICDLTGQELHRNAALQRLLADEPQHHLIAERLRGLAADFGRAQRGQGKYPHERSHEGSLTTERARYLFRASRVGTGFMGTSDAIIVTVHPDSPPPPSEESLRIRFGLTAQQAKVALLLAARKTSPEIAELLFVSNHTARRHVEAVLDKLEISSRRDVRQRIEGDNLLN